MKLNLLTSLLWVLVTTEAVGASNWFTRTGMSAADLLLAVL